MSSTVLVYFFIWTFQSSILKLAAVGDDDRLGGLAGLGAHGFDGLHHLHALGHRAEHDVLAVEPVGLDGAQEELGAVGARARVRHGEDARSRVLKSEVLCCCPKYRRTNGRTSKKNNKDI